MKFDRAGVRFFASIVFLVVGFPVLCEFVGRLLAFIFFIVVVFIVSMVWIRSTPEWRELDWMEKKIKESEKKNKEG